MKKPLPPFIKEMQAKAKGKDAPKKSKGKPFAKGGCSKMAGGGVTRADGCISKGGTKGRKV
jgi:hypothetical protein